MRDCDMRFMHLDICIMRIVDSQLNAENLPSLDLLRPLWALLEERHLSRAAVRVGLSQSAMSRVFHQMRIAFRDELLVRSGQGYKPTPRAEVLHRELRMLLPRLDQLVTGLEFDPMTARARFRVACLDEVLQMLGTKLLHRVMAEAPNMSIDFTAWGKNTMADIETGRIDFALGIQLTSGATRSIPLFDDALVCLIAAENHLGGARLTLENYLTALHVAVVTDGDLQPGVDDTLRALGSDPRKVTFRVPDFRFAAEAIRETPFLLTAPHGAANFIRSDGFRIKRAPIEFDAVGYHLVWNPFREGEPGILWFKELILDTSRAS